MNVIHPIVDQETQKFFEHLDQILLNTSRILNHPQLYFFQLPTWFVGAAPVGKYTVYLGDLLILWQSSSIWLYHQEQVTLLLDGWSRGRKGIWQNKKGIRLVNVAGSALSGANSALGWDIAEQCWIKFSSPTVFGAVKSLREQITLRPLKSPMMSPKTVEELLKNLDCV